MYDNNESSHVATELRQKTRLKVEIRKSLTSSLNQRLYRRDLIRMNSTSRCSFRVDDLSRKTKLVEIGS